MNSTRAVAISIQAVLPASSSMVFLSLQLWPAPEAPAYAARFPLLQLRCGPLGPRPRLSARPPGLAKESRQKIAAAIPVCFLRVNGRQPLAPSLTAAAGQVD